MAHVYVIFITASLAAARVHSHATSNGVAEAHSPNNSIAWEFDKFCEDFGKNYMPEERVERLVIFEATLRLIHAENAKGHPFELGLNSYGDLSHLEFLATSLGLKTSNSTKRWGGLAHLGSAVAKDVAMPASVDWRKRGAITPVKKQESCSSCWTFSAAGALSAAWEIETGNLVALSEQQLLDCTGGNTDCRGGNMDSAFGYALGAGLCTAASYPYQAREGTCRAPGSCSVAIPLGSVVGYRDVSPDDERAMMEAVAQQPVSVGIEAKHRSFHFYKTGVYAYNCGVHPNHGVLLVGYGVQGSAPYWLLRNSWGADWGEGGYFRLLRKPSGPGECGVMTMPSYPVVRAERQPSTSALPSATSSLAASTAAPPSTSGSLAGQGLYGRPPCQEGEIVGNVFGRDAVCMPPCDSSGECPDSAALGLEARPQCVLQNLFGERYCALVCHVDSDCGRGAQCMFGGGFGLCTYFDGVYASAPNATHLQAGGPRKLSAQGTPPPHVFV
mmetsp:Transcript_161232/g.391516  ORF Transcript_161232/g.391516 Transcript_161232/m.391516 type:complete len:500 (+) Transcript_161232:126-1625(+)